MPSAKKILGSTAIYTGASVINKGINFIFLPLFTRLLTPFDFGLVATFEAILGIFSPFVELGTTSAVVRAYFNKNKGFDFSGYFTSSLMITGIGFLGVSLIFLLLKNLISQLFSIPGHILLLVPAVALGSAVISLATRMWIVKQKPVQNGIFRIAQSAVEILISLGLIYFIGLGWKGRILGAGLSEIIFSLVCVIFIIKWGLINLSINKEDIKEILKTGLPLIIHSLNIWILFGIDRFFLNKMVGVSATGIYSVGYTIGSFIGVLGGAHGLAWTPILFESLSKNNQETNRKIVKLTYLSFLSILLLTALFSFLAPIFLNFYVGKSFALSVRYISWVAFGYAAQWMYRLVCGYLLYAKRMIFIPIATTAASLTNILLNYILIKSQGALGAAQATFWAFTVSFILVWIFAQKVYPMPWLYFLKTKK